MEEPSPTPTARGFLAQRFWEALDLDEALEQEGIVKVGGWLWDASCWWCCCSG